MGYSRLPGTSSKFGKTAVPTGVPFGVAMGFSWVSYLSLLPAWFFGFDLLSTGGQ